MWDIEAPTGETEFAIESADEYWAQGLELVAEYLDLPRQAMDLHERSVADALRWVSRARTDSDILDVLFDLWSAIERLLAVEDVSQYLDKKQRKRLKRCLEASREPDQEDVGLSWLSEPQWLRLNEVLDFIEQPSLRTRYHAFVRKYQLPVAQADEHFLWRGMRRKRNDLIHGRHAEIEPLEVDRMLGIVQKMVLAKASHMAASQPQAWGNDAPSL